MTRLLTLLACLTLGPLAACVDDPSVEREGGALPEDPGGAEPGAAGAGSLVPFCAAFDVVRAKCQRCHGDPLKNGAPVPFLSVDDFQRPYGGSGSRRYWQAAIDAVEQDIMPYVALNEPPTSLMPPVEPLTAEEKATLLGWLRQGASAEGGTDCP